MAKAQPTSEWGFTVISSLCRSFYRSISLFVQVIPKSESEASSVHNLLQALLYSSYLTSPLASITGECFGNPTLGKGVFRSGKASVSTLLQLRRCNGLIFFMVSRLLSKLICVNETRRKERLRVCFYLPACTEDIFCLLTSFTSELLVFGTELGRLLPST